MFNKSFQDKYSIGEGLEVEGSNENSYKISEEHVSNEDTYKISEELVSEILCRKSTLQQAVKSLNIYLTNQDLNKHNMGINILADILVLLPQDFLSVEEIQFIVQFFCSEINYHYSLLTAILKGLHALILCKQICKESLFHITTSLFNNVIWQSQTVTDRRLLYTLLKQVISNHLEDYRSCSSEFLFNVISTIDGEKDPRNLLIIFSFLPVLYSSISLGALAEDAFESVACYFPIDFHSSASENGIVKREDLVTAIMPCLLAATDFADLCLLLIQEKLQSSLKFAKIDCYLLLIEGTKCWPSEYIIPHVQNIWRAIKQDYFSPRDPQISSLSTSAFQSVVQVLPNSNLHQLVGYVIVCCEEFLCDIQMTMFEPSFFLLIAAMKSSVDACRTLSNKLLTSLISLFQVTEDKSKVLVLNNIHVLLQTLLDSHQQDPASHFPTFSEDNSWTRLMNVLLTCLEQSYSIGIQQSIFTIYILVSKHLSTDIRKTLYSIILLQVTSHPSKLVRPSCIQCLQELAISFEEEVEKSIMQNLDDHLKNGNITVQKNTFEAISSLVKIKRFLPNFERAFDYLVSLGENYIAIVVSLIRCLLEKEDVQKNKELVIHLFKKSKLLCTLLNSSIHEDDLENAARIVQILIALQDSSDQEAVIYPLVKQILQLPIQRHQVVMLKSMIGSLHQHVNVITSEEIRQFILPVLSTSSVDRISQKSCLELLFSLVNKSSNDDLLTMIHNNMKHFSPNLAVTLHSYITKALVLRRHHNMEIWLNRLIQYLDDDEVAVSASDGFEFIVSKSQDGISNCNIKLFYHQYLYYLVVPHLIQSSTNSQHLKVLGCLLQSVPNTVYVDELKEIMPLLVKSLDTENEKLSLTILYALSSTNTLEDHISTLIPRFLSLSRISPYMTVRIEALQCLSHLLHYSLSALLLPYKQQVITELLQCLGDKKRLVRKKAAYTRSKWFLLGTPTSN